MSDCADSIKMQAATNLQQQDQTPRTEYLTEEDFQQAAKNPRSGSLSEVELQELKGAVVGQPVRQQWLSDQQLRQGGYSSWREYVACGLIRAW